MISSEIVCQYCNKIYPNKSRFNYHQKTAKGCLALQEQIKNSVVIVEPSSIKCQYCEKEFSNQSNLKQHQKTNKSCIFKRSETKEVLLFSCDGCEKTFISKVALDKHVSICYILRDKDKEKLEKELLKEKQENKDLIKQLDQARSKLQLQKEQNMTVVVRLETIIEHLEKINQKSNLQIQELQEKLNQYIYGQKISTNDSQNTSHVFNVQVEAKVNEKPLILNEIVIPTRYIDNYVNLTEMCRAGGKKFNDWRRLEKTKEFLDTLSTSAGIPADLLIKVISRGPNEQRGSWGHPQVAVNVAQWISSKFDVEVSRHILELYTTGSTEIKNFELNQQLENKNEKIKYLENAHDKLLKKRSYYKFKEGPVFYIISDNDSKSLKCKPGMDGEDINVRLQQHRSTTPAIKLEYLIYTDKCVLIENTILEKYSTRRKFLNHEWVFDVEIEEVIASVKTLLNFLGVDYTEETNLEKYNSQIENN
jgi:hypothetical protein